MDEGQRKYRAIHEGQCELLMYFPGSQVELLLEYPGYVPRLVYVPWRNKLPLLEGTELHHICGSGNGAKRVDVAPNMIMVCKSVHRWLETFKIAGFVLCCYAKHRRGELDWVALQQIKGKQLPGWLETDAVIKECEKFPWIDELRKDLLADHQFRSAQDGDQD